MDDIYLFGDIGGHHEPFLSALDDIEVDIDRHLIPDGTQIVQVGDLVHRGPRSDDVVEFVDQMMNNNPQRWHQLVGNHEAMYVGGPEFGSADGDYFLTDSTIDTIRRWWDQGLMFRGLEVQSATYGELLVTHAGLSRPYWQALGEPLTVQSTLSRLENLFAEEIFAPGDMLGAYYTTDAGRVPAGPVWASARTEVYHSWMSSQVPFGQVHGHSTIYNFWNHRWSVSGKILEQMEVKKSYRQTKALFDGKPFFGIDPQLGKDDPYFPISPLKLRGQTRRPNGVLR